jgi:hypothetical protein
MESTRTAPPPGGVPPRELRGAAQAERRGKEAEQRAGGEGWHSLPGVRSVTERLHTERIHTERLNTKPERLNMDHTGCHQLNRVLTAKCRGEKWGIQPTLPAVRAKAWRARRTARSAAAAGSR